MGRGPSTRVRQAVLDRPCVPHAHSQSSWHHAIYTVNDTTAPLHTSANKGREANAYLTFIVDNYDHLPDTMVFVHSHRKGYPEAWHTDAEDYDTVNVLRRLNLTHVHAEGYANLRCNPNPGCAEPSRIEPHAHVNDTAPLALAEAAEVAWLEAWPRLFGDKQDMPEVISATCCAQFAVSRRQVLRRPVADYRRFHGWLMETWMSDEVSGRVMEYAWHMVFGKEAVQYACPGLLDAGRRRMCLLTVCVIVLAWRSAIICYMVALAIIEYFCRAEYGSCTCPALSILCTS